ncbi:MAG: hypothetical protein ACOC9P_03035 [bacterium]
MTKTPEGTGGQLPQHLLDQLQYLLDHLHDAGCAWRLWERVLTREERQRLGDDFEAAFQKWPGAELLFAVARDLPRDLALIDAARKLKILDREDWTSLNRAMIEAYPQLAEYRTRGTSIAAGMPDAVEQAFEEARTRRILAVLACHGLRIACWRDCQIPIDWGKYPKLWDLFFTLAKRAERGNAVDWHTAGAKGPKNLKDRIYRLRKDIMASSLDEPGKTELDTAIVFADEGMYKLDLPPDEVKVIAEDLDVSALDLE